MGAKVNSLDIIQFLLYPAMAYLGYRIGFIDGHDEGNVEGRKAIRKQFEQVGR
jgi:hypothetical protein